MDYEMNSMDIWSVLPLIFPSKYLSLMHVLMYFIGCFVKSFAHIPLTQDVDILTMQEWCIVMYYYLSSSSVIGIIIFRKAVLFNNLKPKTERLYSSLSWTIPNSAKINSILINLIGLFTFPSTWLSWRNEIKMCVQWDFLGKSCYVSWKTTMVIRND